MTMQPGNATYGWMFYRWEDRTPDDPDPLDPENENVIGPFDIRLDNQQALEALIRQAQAGDTEINADNGQPIEVLGIVCWPFRVWDDDRHGVGLGYYIGDPDSEDAFGPLRDYGQPNWGHTSIEYYDDGKWREL